MADRKHTDLHLAKVPEEGELEAIAARVKAHRKQKIKQFSIVGIILAMIIIGTYLLLSYQQYTNVRTSKIYKNDGADNNKYIQFSDGVVRYSSDGVVYLNKKNKEMWNQPCQIANPIINMNEESFAVADSGGNTIMVFTKDGLKGEIDTTLPIEKVSVSHQGIVSAILKNENKPKIISYDATGNILVEHQVDIGDTGYPVSLAMSPDGTLLCVSYVSTQTGALIDKVVYYNFSTVGQDKTDNQVTADDYADAIMPITYFMNDTTSVAIGGESFIIYEGKQIPEAKYTVNLKKEIKSTFHSDKYIGFVLKNTNGTRYELRVYNTNGRQVMSTDFVGEYGNIKLSGKEVIMYEGAKACIYTLNGIQRFNGTLPVDALEIVPVFGMNKYLLISANENRMIRLVK